VTEGTAMAPWNGPNKIDCRRVSKDKKYTVAVDDLLEQQQTMSF